jgi:glycosyltransferase involved in cell wall biosynthesis
MSLDIVIPAHDEEHRIDGTLRSYRAAFPHDDVRILPALDGCTDRTADIVARHRAELEFPKLGKGGVLMEAFRRCDADWIAFVDADGATPPAELARLVAAAEHDDGAIASRRHPASFTPAPRARGRRLGSTGFAWWVRRLFHLPFADTQCGAKVQRRDAVERVVPMLSARDFLFDVDLLVVARALGLRIREVPTIWIDQSGSKLRTAADSRRMLLAAVRLWVHHRFLPIAPPDGRSDGWLRPAASPANVDGGRRVAA